MKRGSSTSEALCQHDYKKLKDLEDLSERLECQICLEIPIDLERGVENCSNGHIVCSSCQDQMNITKT